MVVVIPILWIHVKHKSQFPFKENFSWKSKWRNFIGWNWRHLSINEIVSVRFPRNVFVKRKLRLKHGQIISCIQILLLTVSSKILQKIRAGTNSHNFNRLPFLKYFAIACAYTTGCLLRPLKLQQLEKRSLLETERQNHMHSFREGWKNIFVTKDICYYVKRVRIGNYSDPNTGKHGLE